MQCATAKIRVVEETIVNEAAASRNRYSLSSESVISATKAADDSKRAGADMLPVLEVDYVPTLKNTELIAYLESMGIEEVVIEKARTGKKEDLVADFIALYRGC
jgi:hypothetical protein